MSVLEASVAAARDAKSKRGRGQDGRAARVGQGREVGEGGRYRQRHEANADQGAGDEGSVRSAQGRATPQDGLTTLKQQASTDNEQLPLHFESGARQALPTRLRPMVPLRGDSPFDDADWFFEPWWPGTPALAYVEDFKVRLQIEHLADPMAAFPELAVDRRQFADDQLIVDGTLLVLDDEGKPDADLLRRRLADPTTRDGTPAYVASDLLYDLARAADRAARSGSGANSSRRC